MKKLYISCPVTGRDWKDVVKSFEKMNKLAQIVFDERDGFEIVNIPRVTELKEVTLDDIARHIDDMSKADYFIGTGWFWGDLNRHCNLETELASEYGMKMIKFDYEIVAPDYKDVLRRLEEAYSTHKAADVPCNCTF